MYKYQNSKLSIPARLLYEDWRLVSCYESFKKLCQRGKFVRTVEGKGEGNEAWVSVHDLPVHKGVDFKAFCYQKLGHPKDTIVRNQLEEYIMPDVEAARFFANHRKPNGKPLSAELQREKATSCMILNAVKMVLTDPGLRQKLFGNRKKIKEMLMWEEISKSVNNINDERWLYNLPSNARSLKRKYERYLKEEYACMINANEGLQKAIKIKGEVADFILSLYCLPNKLKVSMVWLRYEQERQDKGWAELTEQAIYNWLYQTEQQRIWVLARDGEEAYDKKFKHTLTRDKSKMFPNSWWSIDGSKFDVLHIDNSSSNGIGAKLKYNILLDVYSEKIIGWSLGLKENHVEHFKTIKMAVNTAGCRPYYYTYDNQSGHKMARMQELYSSLVAVDGGTHHPSRPYAHNNPNEQIFNRFQQQMVSPRWDSDKQGVDVRLNDNKANWDFIKANKHKLKTVEELYKVFEALVSIWNTDKHPTLGCTRNEAYMHPMPVREELTVIDLIDKMWIEQTKPVKYRAHGLDMWLGGKKHQFEVYNANGAIDLDFRWHNTNKKFIVRYDPEFLDQYVQLCERDENGNIVTVAHAHPKRKFNNVPALMNEGEKVQWAEDHSVRDKEKERSRNMYKEISERSGITIEREMDEQELMVKMKSRLTKEQRSKVEATEHIYSRF